MASNAVIASTIKDIAGVELTWMLWFKAALVPGLIVLFLCPLVVYKLYPPQMKDLGDIKPFVVSKMQEMGAMKKDEKILLALFIMAILGWMAWGENWNQYVCGCICFSGIGAAAWGHGLE